MATTNAVQTQIARIQSPAVATVAPKISREIAFRPTEPNQPINWSPITNGNMNVAGVGVTNLGSGHGNSHNVSHINLQSRRAETDLTFMENDEPVQNKNMMNMMIPERERITTDLPPMTSIAISKPVKDSNRTAIQSQSASPLKSIRHHVDIKNSAMANGTTTTSSSATNFDRNSHSNHHDKGNLIYQSQAESDNLSHHRNSMNMRTQHHHAGTHDLSRIRVSGFFFIMMRTFQIILHNIFYSAGYKRMSQLLR